MYQEGASVLKEKEKGSHLDGSFTSSARKEAVRDGAPEIDLVDGDELCEILKRLNLGIKVNVTETVEINTDWFMKI
jgi:restriction system protein